MAENRIYCFFLSAAAFVMVMALASCAVTPGSSSAAGGGGPSSGASSSSGSSSSQPVTVNPHHSFNALTTCNGLAAGVYDTSAAKMTAFKDHIYSSYDSNTSAKNFMYDLYFGYRKNGVSTGSYWLSSCKPSLAEYVNASGIIHTVQATNGFVFDSWYFIPFHYPGGQTNTNRLLVCLVRVSNAGADAADSSVFSILNFHAGGDSDNAGESISTNGPAGYVLESKGGNLLLYKNLVSNDMAYSADNGAYNPWGLVNSGAHYSNYILSSGNDITVGFENRLGGGTNFTAGGSAWFGVVVGFTSSAAETDLWSAVNGFINGRGPKTILDDETAWWSAWQSAGTIPSGLTSNETLVYRQSAAVLKMAQVREPGKGYGAVLASLIPGIWSICWVRDGCYAVNGLVASGHTAEAKDCLGFFLGADVRMDGASNFYQKNYIESSTAGSPIYSLNVRLRANYAISVCRYFGCGLEESDLDGAGYNIEFDNWGLFLWAFDSYFRATSDTAFLSANWNKISAQVADLLVDLIDTNLSIIQSDSSIWERHWTPYGLGSEPETRKHFAYTSICAYNGLLAASNLAVQAGDTVRATNYGQKAALLRNGVLSNFIYTPSATGQPMIAGNLEEMASGSCVDEAAAEAVNFNLIASNGALAAGTVAAFDRFLRTGTTSPGFIRNDDGTWYDNQEWVMIDLRVASAFICMGDKTRGKAILDWVTSQSVDNYNLIGELFDRNTGDYAGASPMCGFGPGAYILALRDYYQ